MAETKNLQQRILAVTSGANGLKADVDVKGFGGGYKGVSHDSVVRTVRELCVKHGVAVWPSVVEYVEDELTTKSGNPMQKITVTMDTTFVNADDPSESVTVRTVGIGIDSQDKGPGKAMSYAKKYALMLALMLTTGDNDEERHEEPMAPRRQPRRASAPDTNGSMMSGKQKAFLLQLAKTSAITDEERESTIAWASVERTAAAASKVIDKLQAKIAARDAGEPDFMMEG